MTIRSHQTEELEVLQSQARGNTMEDIFQNQILNQKQNTLIQAEDVTSH